MSYTKTGPFTDGAAPALTAAFFNNVEASLVASSSASTAPAATGIAATDTANLQAAITAAQTAKTDLILPTGSYVLTSGLTWNLARGSLRGTGDVKLDFTALTSGAALTVTGNGNSGVTDGPHLPIRQVISGLQLVGPNTDTTTVDGILETDPGEGLDQGAIAHVAVSGFRDGITFGTNVWSMDHQKVYVEKCHRYGLNLTFGTNSGESVTFTGVTVSGCSNASKTAAAVYTPSVSGADVRFFGGSLDYNNLEGLLQGGSVAFFAVHFEDNNSGPMFQYSSTAGGDATSVTFDDCAWDSSTTSGVRDHIHEILASSQDKVTVTFNGDKGGLYPGTYSTWLLDNSGSVSLNVTSTVRNFAVDSSNGTGLLMGDYYNLLSNGSFSDSSSFVASPGVGGWATSGTGTWSIGAGGSPGNGLTVTAATAASGQAFQRIPLSADRRPIRVAGKMFVSTFTSGAIGLNVQFYAADGTTAILGQIRIQSNLVAVSTAWTQYFRRFIPPKGAAYMAVQLVATSFVGTAVFDQIEVVPV